MKLWLTLPLLVSITSIATAGQPIPPTGQQVLQIFFENINKPLKNEPLCQLEYFDVFADGRPFLAKTLAESVAANLGMGIAFMVEEDDSEFRRTSILTKCDPHFYENGIKTPDGGITSGWDCYVHFRESMIDEPWVSQSTIQLIIKPDLSGLVPGTIKCF